MTTIAKSVLAAIAVAIVGLVFTEIFAAVFTGLEIDTARILGSNLYVCIVLVTCTGVILSEMKKK